MSINKLMMVGRLVRDPQTREVGQSMLACRMTLAVNTVVRNPEGGKKEEVCYIDMTTWNKEAEYCARNLRKGSMVIVDGRLKLETWKDKTGKDMSKHVIHPEKIIPVDALPANETEAEVPKAAPAPQQSYYQQPPRFNQAPALKPQQPVAPANGDWENDLPF